MILVFHPRLTRRLAVAVCSPAADVPADDPLVSVGDRLPENGLDLLLEDGADLLFEIPQILERMNALEAGRARHAREIDIALGQGMAAIGLVGAILENQMHEILRRGGRQRDERAEIH